MTQRTVELTDVSKAMEELRKEGLYPSAKKVHARLGRGIMGTILGYIQEIQKATPLPPRPSAELTVDVDPKLAAQLKPIRDEAELKAQEKYEAYINELEGRNTVLETQLEEARQAVINQEDSVIDMTFKTAAAEQKAETHFQELSKALEENKTLNNKLNEVLKENSNLTARLESARTVKDLESTIVPLLTSLSGKIDSLTAAAPSPASATAKPNKLKTPAASGSTPRTSRTSKNPGQKEGTGLKKT